MSCGWLTFSWAMRKVLCECFFCFRNSGKICFSSLTALNIFYVYCSWHNSALQKGSKFGWGSYSNKRVVNWAYKTQTTTASSITSLLPSCNSEPWVLYSMSLGKKTRNNQSFEKLHLEVTVSTELICWAAYSQSSLVSQRLCTQNWWACLPYL